MKGSSSITRLSRPPQTTEVWVLNRQRRYPICRPALQQITRDFLESLHCSGTVAIHLIGPRAMARLNWQHLQHEGSTDILTFDQGSTPDHLRGELFISPADADTFAKEYRTSWREEVARYVLHGLLHLCGHTDAEAEARSRMKREENRRFRQWKKSLGTSLKSDWPAPSIR